MRSFMTRLLSLPALATLTAALPVLSTPIHYTLRAPDSAAPVAGTVYIDLIDGDGIAGSSVRLTNLSAAPTATEGAITTLPEGYRMGDDGLISTLAFSLPNVYQGLSFTLNPSWAGDSSVGFPDALVLSLADANGAPLFSTADPRGQNVFLTWSAGGIENYVPSPFAFTASTEKPELEAVPEPQSLVLFALGFGLLLIPAIRGKKRLALLAVLSLGAIAPGAAHAALNNVTSQVAVERAPVVYNRATKTFHGLVTLRNTSDTLLGAPLYLVVSGLPFSVSVNNAMNLTADGKPMLKLPAPPDGLPPGGSIRDYTIRFHNPDKLKFSATFQVLSYSGVLPPDPGEAGKATVAGVDANANGVRDDVEIYIAVNFGHSRKLVMALDQMAAAGQRGLVAASQQQSMDAGNADMRAMECLRYVAPGSTAWKSVEAVTLNTPQRLQAWDAHEQRLGGNVFPRAKNKKASCAFDPAQLPN